MCKIVAHFFHLLCHTAYPLFIVFLYGSAHTTARIRTMQYVDGWTHERI